MFVEESVGIVSPFVGEGVASFSPACFVGEEAKGAELIEHVDVLAWDAEADLDVTNEHTFDLDHPPFSWQIRQNPCPDDPIASISVRVSDSRGLRLSNPLGLMLVDYNARPGEGQAYPILFP